VHRFASVALVDGRGWLLLQERDANPGILDPERWGFPGGHVEDGEDYRTCAYRELAEETGVELDPAAADLVLFGRFRFFSEPCGEDDEFELWAGRTDLAEVACHEGRQMVFVDPAVARGLPLTASATLALPALLDSSLYRELTA
jgi:8-oxo-dGTP pyrophosphatase MutT (NUDIX family)